MAIPSPSEAQWNEERASIDREILRRTIMSLKSQVSRGLSGFRYEHLQTILFSVHSKAGRLAKSAFDELHSLSNDNFQGRLLEWINLTALNKKDAADLETNKIMDVAQSAKAKQ